MSLIKKSPFSIINNPEEFSLQIKKLECFFNREIGVGCD